MHTYKKHTLSYLTTLLAGCILPLSPGAMADQISSGSCTITAENAPSVELLYTLTDHTDGVWNAVFSPDGDLLATCTQDQMVLLREVNDLDSVIQLTGHEGWVLGLAFSPDGQILASAGTDGFTGTTPGEIRLWDVATSSQLRILPGHNYGCWSLDFQESSGLLVSGGKDRLVKIWDPSTGDILDTLTGHAGWVLSVDYNPHQDLIASSATDNTVRVWNSETGTVVHTLTNHTNNVGFVKFSPDGTRLASSADDGTVRLWDVASGDQIWSCSAGQGWVNCVNFSPDGELMLTCGHNSSVVLRRSVDGAELVRLDQHTGPVLRGSFNPEGTMFATASWDQTVRIWGLTTTIDSTGHTPTESNSNDTVTVYAQVVGCMGIEEVNLYYDAGSGFQAVAMVDDGAHGDGAAGDLTFAAYIPPLPPGTSVYYYVSVTDARDSTRVDPVSAPIVCYQYTVDCCAGMRGNVNFDELDEVDIGDLTALISYLFIPPNPEPACLDEANVNGDTEGTVDIGDLTSLIGYLFIPPNVEPTACG
ncbi:MAG: hypothetical protein JSU65_10740 [Candidatus Zixiibacteriota bacterium]|nr:MAG: hypothetical protein JSU65_10740 [candidate division Zixibacteria bacterium]